MVLDPLMNNIKKRHHTVEELNKTIEEIRSEINRLNIECEEKLKIARKKNMDERQSTLSRVELEIERNIAEEKDHLSKEYKTILNTIFDEYDMAQHILKKEVAVLSNDLVEKIL
jgi:F0F1-type ATP synthase membrane subunit b/b'